MYRLRTTVAALAMAAAMTSAGPATAENVVHFASIAGGAVTMDPHSYLSSHNRVATEQVYEALLDIDSNLAIVPQLALAWKPLNPTTWEFALRTDVTFHDGAPFTAEDVVFSIERARAETSGLLTLVDGIASADAIDAHTIRVTTTGPDPSLWLKLAGVAIMSRTWAERHGVTTPADYNRAREETYPSRHANRHRAIHGRSVRAARRIHPDPQSGLVGHGRLSAQYRPDRPHLEG